MSKVWNIAVFCMSFLPLVSVMALCLGRPCAHTNDMSHMAHHHGKFTWILAVGVVMGLGWSLSSSMTHPVAVHGIVKPLATPDALSDSVALIAQDAVTGRLLSRSTIQIFVDDGIRCISAAQCASQARNLVLTSDALGAVQVRRADLLNTNQVVVPGYATYTLPARMPERLIVDLQPR